MCGPVGVRECGTAKVVHFARLGGFAERSKRACQDIFISRNDYLSALPELPEMPYLVFSISENKIFLLHMKH